MAYLAPALVQLRNEISAAHPNRDRTSDGWIGDASHQARKSGHNPDPPPNGVVRATDTDKDGPDMARLLEIARNDDRVEYVIWEGHIYLRSNGSRKQKYNGTNGHFGHMHIEIRTGKAYENNTRSWGYSASPAPAAPTSSKRLPLDQIARQVIAGSWGIAEDRKNRLTLAGYNAAAVQAEVNRQFGAKPVPARKSVDVIAQEVVDGHWGNNPERSRKLQASGYSPTEVQARVNTIVGSKRPVVVRLSVSTLADQVIEGQWGAGPERRRRLIAATYDYNAVQAEVNRRLR